MTQGWGQIIRFDDLKPVNTKELAHESRFEHVVCSFINEVIYLFNHNTLPARLACVAKLSAMVSMLGIAALTASIRSLPYVASNRFDAVSDGKRLPLFHFTNDYPGVSEQ